ncbi:MBL fold metallo-hydrolase [bacterium]|nr:MAG: MBL fold metallo-hydrolase [bacterium]
MKVTNGLEMLEVKTEMFGTPRTIYMALLRDGDTALLVDTGYPGQFAAVRQAIEAAGVALNRIHNAIITHHDIDHIGGLPGLRAALPQPPRVLAHEVEAAYIRGEKTPLKLAALEANLASLPQDRADFYQKLKSAFQASFTPVDETLADGQVLPWCGGVQVVHTPGHTLGHICLYLPQGKTLIAGDALTMQDGALARPNPAINYDTQMCGESLRKLARFDIETVVSYHGGLFRGDATRRIAELAEA